MSDAWVFIWGMTGGGFVELVGLYKIRDNPNLPSFLSSWFYWVVTIAMIIAGGILAFVYNRTNAPLSEMLAINIGASAPLILRTLSSKPPPPGSSD